MNILAFVRSRIGWAVVAALAVALAGQTYRLDRAQTALTVERSAHLATSAQLATANAGLAQIEAHGHRLDEAAARASSRIEAAAKTLAARLERIKAQPAPTSCEAALELLRRDAAGGL